MYAEHIMFGNASGALKNRQILVGRLVFFACFGIGFRLNLNASCFNTTCKTMVQMSSYMKHVFQKFQHVNPLSCFFLSQKNRIAWKITFKNVHKERNVQNSRLVVSQITAR
jgi:hypothetical protein